MNTGTILLSEQGAANRILQTLEEQTGIKAVWLPLKMANGDKSKVDGKIAFTIKGTKFELFAEFKREVRLYQLNQIYALAAQYRPLLIIADRIFPAMKEKLREEGIAYLDGAGNLFLNNNDKLVWIEGNKAKPEEKDVPNRAFTKTGLKVLFILLSNQRIINAPYREIAKAANVALGNIPMVFAGLRESGYLLPLNDKEVTLQNKKELLGRWINGFQETLKPALHLGNYSMLNKHTNGTGLKLPEGDVWSGEPAANRLHSFLNPEIYTIYTQEHRATLMKDWRLVPDKNGKIEVYEKFWINEEDNKQLAPPLIVYADLLLTNDPRCKEAAEMIYNQFLKPNFE